MTTTRRFHCSFEDCEVEDWTSHGEEKFHDTACFMCKREGTLLSFSGVEIMRSDDVEFPITPAPVMHSMIPHIDWTKIDTLKDLVES